MEIHPPKIGIHQEFAQFMGSNDDVMGVQWGHDEPELELGCNGYTVTGLHECGLVRFPLNKFQKYGAGFKPQKRVRKPPMYSGDIGYVYIYIHLITYNIYKYIHVYMIFHQQNDI